MKKTMLVLTGACLLTACVTGHNTTGYTRTTNESYIIKDENGNYAGKIDGSYRIYDKNGNYAGRIDSSSRIYDRDGNYIGRVNK